MRRIAPVLVSLWWTGLMLVGPPAALIRLVGWPLPDHRPTRPELEAWVQQPLTRGSILGAAAVVGWLMWACFLAVVLVEAYRRAARLVRCLPTIRLPGPLQGLSAAMLGTVAVSSSVGAATPAAAHAAVAGADAPRPARPQLTGDDTATPAAVPKPTAGAAEPGALDPADRRPHTLTVHRGDTLWDLAQARLGDPRRWPEIYRLNADHYDRHGRMVGGDHIEPGWVLALPDDATPAGAPSARPSPPTGHQPASGSPPPTIPTASLPSPTPTAPPTTAPPPSPSPAAPAAPHGGVVPPVASPTGTGSAPTSPCPATAPVPAPRSPRANPPGICLPGGSWVDLGLAAAIAAAAALVWIQRRRRYQPRPPSPQLRLDDPDLAPLPPVVTDIRHGLRRATAPPNPDDADANAADDADDAEQQWHESQPAGEPDASLDAAPVPVPVAPNLDHPLLQVWPPAGLGLVGPGAEAAGRGFLVAALSADGRHGPEARGRVIIPAGTLATLLDSHAVTVADTSRLTVTTGLPEALDLLEEQTLHRTRLVFDHEVDDVAALREADPAEEPLPPLLLIADTGAGHERTRIAAVLTQGQRLDIHGMLLGAWPDGNTVVIAPDGTTSRADGDRARHGGHPADVGRLAVLDPAQTADLLRTLAEAHTGAAQPAPPVQPGPPAPRRPADTPPTGNAAPDEAKAPNEKKAATARPTSLGGAATTEPDGAFAEAPGEVQVASAPQATGAAEAATATTSSMPAEDADRPAGQPAAGPGDPVASDEATGDEPDADEDDEENDDGADDGGPDCGDGEPAQRTQAGHAQLVVLGTPRIVDLPLPRKPGEQPLRSKALEVLVYLVASGGQAPKHRIIADVLAAERHSKSRARLNTYVSNLRACLARAGGRASYVAGPDEQYALNRDAVDVDLWRMQAAIAAADAARDDRDARMSALRVAVACYAGPLAEGRDYEWVEPLREAVRQQAVDAHLALVAALADDDPAEAATVLRAAIDHDPHNEPLYQQAMHLYARLRDVDGIRDLRRVLTRRLAEVDTEPGEDTIALADRLVTDLQRRPRGPSRLPRDAA
jgi:DNA-binding SARP family transcriptional activator